MKTNFFEKNRIVVLYALQACFILLAIIEAVCHRWPGFVSNLIMAAAIVVFINGMRRANTILMLMDLEMLIARSKVLEAKLKDKKPETEEEVAERQKMLDSLVGLTIVKTGHCDTCPNEQSDCKKLILADGSHLCVKDCAYRTEDAGDKESIRMLKPF